MLPFPITIPKRDEKQGENHEVSMLAGNLDIGGRTRFHVGRRVPVDEKVRPNDPHKRLHHLVPFFPRPAFGHHAHLIDGNAYCRERDVRLPLDIIRLPDQKPGLIV